MPGVADAIRKTQLVQEQRSRKQEMEELIKMVGEGRLHEADERQLETLKLALDLNTSLNRSNPAPQIDSEAIANAVAKALEQVVKEIPTRVVDSSGEVSSQDSSRPSMKHINLANLTQSDEKVEIVDHGGLVQEGPETKDSADKLAKLKKLRDGQG